MRKIFFETKDAHAQYNEWERNDRKVFEKIIQLLDDARNNPFKGLGKPEPLKHQYKGCWSRRITNEHRLVYKVTADSLIVISCKYHY